MTDSTFDQQLNAWFDSLPSDEYIEMRNKALLIQGFLRFGEDEFFVMPGGLVEIKITLDESEIIVVSSIDRANEFAFAIAHDLELDDGISFRVIADLIRDRAKDLDVEFNEMHGISSSLVDYDHVTCSTIVEYINNLTGVTEKSAFGHEYTIAYSYPSNEAPAKDAINDVILDGVLVDFSVMSITELLVDGEFFVKGKIDYGYPVTANLLLRTDFKGRVDFADCFRKATKLEESLERELNTPFLGETNGFQ